MRLPLLKSEDFIMTTEMLQVQDNQLHPVGPTPEEKLEQLERILHSRVLQGSESLVALLRYLVREEVADPGVQIRESTIAQEVFGCGSHFDSRTNSVVRVQTKRLRTKLQEYYETEGVSDRVFIDLPKGHYKVAFSYAPQKDETSFTQDAQAEAGAPPDPALSDVASTPPARKADVWKNVLILAIIILTVAVAVLASSIINLRKQTQEAVLPVGKEADLGFVWSPFLKSNAPTLTVLSNPAVYRFLNNSDPAAVSKDSLQITTEQAQMLGEVLKNKLVMKQNRAPRLVLSTANYTGIGEAIGLYHLTSLFKTAGRDLTLKQSRTISAEDLKNHSVILLGSAWVNDWVEKLPVKESFVYGVNASIENKDPQPGEEREYRPRYNEQTGEVEEDYALITVKPGLTGEHRLMILAGILSEGTQAAAEYVTRKDYLGVLNQRLQSMTGEGGPPNYYQVLLKVNVDNGIPTTVSILAIHTLKMTRD
jgi:hypothetical protein